MSANKDVIDRANELSKKMKPCPFCGQTQTASENQDEPFRLKIGYVPSELDDSLMFIAICHRCGASTGTWQFTPEKALEAWNRRAGK